MRGLVISLMAAGISASAVQAHHSYAGFHDPKERTVVIDGTLERFMYASPHVQLSIRTADSTSYTVIWQSSNWVRMQAKVEADTFKPGDRLIVIAAPSKDASETEVTQVREVRRPSDGWVWRSGIPYAAPAAPSQGSRRSS